MGHYIVNRLIQTFVVIFGVSLIAFGVTFATGDPAYLLVGPQATQEQIDTLRHQLGFDRPWPIQYLDYMSRALRGDFGVSLRSHEPAFGLIMSRMPLTLELAGAALVLSLVVAVPVGILSATRRNTLFDTFAMLGALLGQSMPAFWLGLMLILIFGVELRWFPISGAGDIQHLVLPAITLGAFGAARNARLIRSSVLDALSNDYVRTAKAKGLSEPAVILRHVIKNSMLPVITVIGLDLGALLGGAVITETIFAWPGVGRLIVQSIETKDYPLIQTAVILLAVLFVVLNLLVDLTYTYLDPRIQSDVSANLGALSESPARMPLPSEVHKHARRTGPAWLTSLRRARLAPIGVVLLVVLLMCAIFAGQIAPYDPNQVQVVNRLKPPFWMAGGSLAHPLGTDQVGRDLLSRVIFGARISMLVGVSTVLVAGVIGTLLGLFAGYRRGWSDSVIMRLGEIQLAFPLILLAIAVLAVLGPGVNNLILVLGTYGWVIFARVVRAQTLSWREKEFVDAALCVGASSTRIMLRHILPNIYASLIIIASFAMATNVLAEASLSFLGLGAPPNVPSWGAMLASARDYLQDAWWLATFPGIALMLTILSINLVGDWLRDYLDPRLKI